MFQRNAVDVIYSVRLWCGSFMLYTRSSCRVDHAITSHVLTSDGMLVTRTAEVNHEIWDTT